VVATTVLTGVGARLGTGSHRSFNDDYRTDVVVGTVTQSRHTVSIADLSNSGQALTAAAALVGGDLFQSFGAAECPQLTADGEVRWRHWHVAKDQIDRVASRHSIPVVDDPLAFF
jgi:hypothetical protein